MASEDYPVTFKGKTAIVTGATRGIGKAIADLLWELGAHVIYTGRARFSESGAGERRDYWPLDAESDESVDAFQTRMLDLPQLDILVNNAGTSVVDAIDAVDDADWNSVLTVNLTAPMKLMRAASKIMKDARNGGRILNVSSLFGVIARPNRHAYTASKSALSGLTRSAGLELAPEGILVNAIAPGFILTDLTRKMLSVERRKSLEEIVPIGRMGNEEEIAKFSAFLVSDANTYLVGQTVTVDGGMSVSPGFA